MTMNMTMTMKQFYLDTNKINNETYNFIPEINNIMML